MNNTKHKKVTSLRGTKQSPSYRKKAIFWLLLGIIVMLTAFFSYLFWPRSTSNQQSSTNNQQPTTSTTSLRDTKQSPTETQPVPIPTSYDLVVPYAPQAPFSNWTVHEESCEEAAIYMYRAYLEGIQYPLNRISETEADTAFRAMKTWQVAHYGKEPDLTMTALGAFVQSYYGYTPTVKKDITAEDIKVAIAAGHPVIVPVMTHSLLNSMYGPVSVYHVLLIKGYDATGVITNDAGVGNGPDHHYTWEILWQAIDAQTAKMGQGRELLYLTK